MQIVKEPNFLFQVINERLKENQRLVDHGMALPGAFDELDLDFSIGLFLLSTLAVFTFM